MKNILYIFAVVVMMFATACSKEDDHSGQGAVSFALSSNVLRADSDNLFDALKDKLSFRIYSVANKGLSNEQETLVRLYTYDEIIGNGSNPMKIWLLAGDYRVKVEGGEKSEASFTDIYYRGQSDFTVAESMTDQQIEVMCRPANAMIKVVFDSSVATNMGATAKVVVAIADEYDPVAVAANAVPNLTYKSTSTGFFMPEEDAEKFVWRFSGTVAAKDNAEVVKMGEYTPADGFKEGYMYTLNFKYSPDLGGYLTLNVEVDDEPEIIGGTAVFKPEPQFDATAQVADGYDNIVGETAQMYSGKKVGYNIKAISDITELKISIEGQSPLTYTSSQVMQAQSVVAASTRGDEPAYIAEYKDAQNGVTIRVVNSREWNLLLEPAFSQKLSAGEQEYIISVTDDALAMAEYVQKYIGEGVSSLIVTAGREWEGHATLKANLFNPAAQDLKLYYKESKETDYKSVPMTNGEVAVTGLRGGRVYDAYVSYTVDGNTVDTGLATLKTPNGVQIPNGGMETWSGGTPRLPYNYKDLGVGEKDKNVSLTWDSGNHGSSIASTNLTTPVEDPRPGSSGKTAAQLQSRKVTFLGIGEFAAGNIFYGRYANTEHTSNGIIDFGQPFTYDYKPDKLVVWYRGVVGTVNNSGGGLSEGDSDKAQIFVWLYSKDKGGVSRYRVRTYYPSTFVNPNGTYVNNGDSNSTSHNAGDIVEGLVAYGYWNRTQTETQINGIKVDMSYSGWTKIEIPLVYVDNNTKPDALVISCAASAYGDYFAGSTSSVMYVDDFEFVY